MTYIGIEPIIHELVRRMREDLPAEIESINESVIDEFTLSVPNETDVFDHIPPVGMLNSFPAIGIGDGRATFEDDAGSSETGVFKPMIVIYEQAASQRELSWKLRRLHRAVVNVTLAGRNLGEAAWGVTFDLSEPGPTLADDPDRPQEWVSWTGIRIACKRDEY